MIHPIDLLRSAADLMSESGENPEYDRAIVELTSGVLGLWPEHRDALANILRAIR